ncbi:eukaryotic translation initiation factor 3 subunit 7 [Obelidium mucronatum]|nr:eukaryotic translation initiation factor 3 subunit 7 [Obelidium mucronatum]
MGRGKSKSPTRSKSPARSAAAPPSFLLPSIIDNPGGWGPPASAEGLEVFAALNQVPYAPFSRFDRIGKVADWSAPVGQAADEQTNQRNTRRNFGNNNEAVGSGTASAFAFAFSNNELLDEASFSVVDRVPTAGTGAVRKLTNKNYQGSYAQKRGGGAAPAGNVATFANRFKAGAQPARGGYARRGGFGGRYNDKVTRLRDASIAVGIDWKVMEEIEFNRLGKLYFEVEDPEDLSAHGKCQFYDKSYDRLTTKTEKRLNPTAASGFTHTNPTASADPLLQSYADQTEGRVVIASADVVAAIMCCGKSVYGWDLVITKTADRIVFDKRDGGYFDLNTVNENATEPPVENETDTLNTPTFLAQESTQILQNYAAQVLKTDTEPFLLKEESPFSPEAEASGGLPLASGIQRYRKWDLGDDISLIARTTLDAVVEGVNNDDLSDVLEESVLSTPVDINNVLFSTVRCLNEFDSRAVGSGGAPDWRAKLDQQRGAVMVSEIKNNGNKLVRWTVESILSGADVMKIGFVSRSNIKDRTKHGVLAGMTVKPVEFAQQMNYATGAGWGILRAMVDLIFGWSDGKYVMVKDANKPIIRLYSVSSDFGTVVPSGVTE